MIAGGNTVVFNPHPNAKKTTIFTINMINEASLEAGGPDNIACTVENPTMESSAIRSYKEALDEFTGELKRSAKKCGASYHLCSTGVGFDKIIFEELKDIYEF